MKMRLSVVGLVLLAGTVAGARVGEEGTTMLEKVAEGEFWYAMTDDASKPIGYARLTVERMKGGGLAVDWELKLAHEGGSYEETRTMAVDGAGDLLSSDYRSFGNLVCSGKMEDGKWLVTTLKDGAPVTVEGERPVGAMTGMGFVFAAACPREEGGELERSEVDEANGFEPAGKTVFAWKGSDTRDWEGERLPVHRILMSKANGKEMPILVAADGRIVFSDWGGGNRMTLSKTETKALFKPEPPILTEVESGPETLVLRGDLVRFSPGDVYDHYTQPSLLTKFWAPEAEIEAKVGGKYHLSWPGPGWKLVGTVKEAERGKRLTFTWNWAHTPDVPELLVTMTFAPREGGGTVVTVTQGPYRDTPEDAKERAGHLQGWQYFFARLRALRGK